MTNAINWFEIPAVDMDRAVRFYQEVLGAQLRRETFHGEDIAVFARGTDRGVVGALVRREGFVPATGGPLVYLDARGDLDGCVARAAKAGGRVVVPRTDIGPMGQFAIIADSEGNAVGLHTPAAPARVGTQA